MARVGACAVRDLDVLLDHLAGEVALLGADRASAKPLLAVIEARTESRSEERSAGRSTRSAISRCSVSSATQIAGLEGVEAGSASGRVAKAEFKKLEKAAAGLPPDPTDEQLHAVRIRAKRARYAAEFAGDKKLAPYVTALKRVQDVVGEHQDAVVAQQKSARQRRRSDCSRRRPADRARARAPARAPGRLPRRAWPQRSGVAAKRSPDRCRCCSYAMRAREIGRPGSGDDRERPLDARGIAQARNLVELLEPFAVEAIYTSPYLRCTQTVEAARGGALTCD